MISDVNKIFKKYNNFVNLDLKLRLYVSNSTAPKLHRLPKIHKTGKSMTHVMFWLQEHQYLGKWSTKKFENSPITPNIFSVENSFDFSKRIINLTLQEDEILISSEIIAEKFTDRPLNLIYLT